MVLDPRFPNERAVDAYVKVAFPALRATNVRHVRFDQVVSHGVYYCDSHRYALVEYTYFRAEQATLKDPSGYAKVDGAAVYPVTPTPEGSLNAWAEAWACGTAKGRRRLRRRREEFRSRPILSPASFEAAEGLV